MTISNWSLVAKSMFGGYCSPETEDARVYGTITGNPVFADGVKITTSRIVLVNQHTVLTKTGSAYALGEVDPEYAHIFPDAYQRLLNAKEKQNEFQT
jgi:hypothetical protein